MSQPTQQEPLLNSAQLSSLAVASLLILAPHADHLPLWSLPLFLALTLLKRFYFGPHRPRIALRLALTLLLIGLLLQSHGRLIGLEAGTTLLSGLIGLKLLEAHDRRDGVVLLLLNYFLAALQFLFQQDLPISLYLLLALIINTALLAQLFTPNVRYQQQLRLTLILTLQAIPIALLLFYLFPRLSSPLWRLPDPGREGVTGLSAEMSPGRISELTRSAAVAFRVEFSGPLPPPQQRYWRGPVLWQFDGHRWSRLPTQHKPGSIEALGSAIDYRITLEPSAQPWLLGLDMVTRLPAKAQLNGEFQLIAEQPIYQTQQVSLRSHLDYHIDRQLPLWQQQASLQLPKGLNPKSRQLAQDWMHSLRTHAAVVQKALSYFREQPFYYTLRPPPLGSENEIDQFLFSSRRGFCEHYAASFVVLMRSAGIPARVVTGYLGGELNPFSRYLIVRQADAHAWAEVWLEGRGWMRVDPTSAVAPVRVEEGIDAALPADDRLQLGGRQLPPLFGEVRLLWDAINHNWQQWVVDYNFSTQQQLLQHLGLKSLSQRLLALGGGIGLILLLITTTLLIRRPMRQRDAALRAYQLLQRKAAKVGIDIQPSEGPAHFQQRLTAVCPLQQQPLNEIFALYIAQRYGRQPGTEEAQQLYQRVRRLHLKRAREQKKLWWRTP